MLERRIGRVMLLAAASGWCLLSLQASAGVVEIDQAKALAGSVTAGDAAGFPVTISESGSYRLSGNLNLSDPNVNAIDITANDVTLDLNGFAVIGPGGTIGRSIGISGFGRTNISVRNGSVIAMPSIGIRLGNRARLRNLRVFLNSRGLEVGVDAAVFQVTAVANRLTGIQMVADSSVINSVVSENGGHGISGGSRCLILNNLVNENEDSGVVVGSDSTVLQNTIGRNGSFGIELGSRTGFAANVLTNNNGSNSNPQVSGSGFQLGSNVCGSNKVCP